MKHLIRKLRFTLPTYLLTALLLNACQQSGLSIEKAQFQSKAAKTVNFMATSISNSFRGRGAVAPIASHFDTNYSQNALYSQPLQYELQRCLYIIQQIPRTAENYQRVIATETQCLTGALQYRNMMLTFTYQNLNPYSQNQYAYNMNYPGQSPYQNFGGLPASQLGQYANQGFVP